MRAAGFIGTREQLPPPYSAVKHEGKPLHHYARAGIEVEPKPRLVNVEEIEVGSFERGVGGVKVGLRVTCGPGTYIRSLVHDIGRGLGCGACVAGLRRVRSGEFMIEDSFAMDVLRSGEVTIAEAVMTMEEATSWLPTVAVTGEAGLAVTQGKPLQREWVPDGQEPDESVGAFRVMDEAGRLLAIYGPARAEDTHEVCGRAVRVVRPNTLKAEDDEAA